MLPQYEIQVYTDIDVPPAEVEEMFSRQLADYRKGLSPGQKLRNGRQFALVCAVTHDGHALGGVHLDIGPIGGGGPLAECKLAYLERTLVRPEYRRQGLATLLLRRAVQIASEAACEYIRCSNNWDNVAETALFRRCGFALVDIDGESDPELCYLAVRALQNLQ